MIEMTTEMVRALWRVLPSEVQEGREPDDIEPWVEAVLTAVERGHAVRPKRTRPTDHDFQPHDDPKFGSAIGGGCGAQVTDPGFGTVTCGWPRIAHRSTPTPTP